MEATNSHSHIDTCFNCVAACERCITACLQEEHLAMMVDCIRLCRECTDFCTLCGRLDARGSDFSRQFMVLCADVCEACAAECSQHDDAHCQACAEACRNCADECRRMSASA